MNEELGRVVSLLTIPEYAKKWRIPPEIIRALVKRRMFPVQLFWDGKAFLDPDLRPNLCSMATYCKIWGITRWSVKNWVKKGILPPVLHMEDNKKDYFDPFRVPPVIRKSKGFKKAMKGKNV